MRTQTLLMAPLKRGHRDTELASHYFQAVLPAQFDEYVWFAETRAVTPLPDAALMPADEARGIQPAPGSSPASRH